MNREPCVYILASKRNGTLYTGVTSDLAKRVYQHREGTFSGFAKKYEVSRLVYFEMHESIEAAITREKQIKEWNRAWKMRLIEELNPDWDDLFEDICR